MILTGTPGGTVFKGIYPSAYVRGGWAWLAGGCGHGRNLYGRAVTILGGTSEIQRNILARAMLGI